MNLEALNAVLLENFDEALNAKSGEGWFDGLNPTLAQIDAATASKLAAPVVYDSSAVWRNAVSSSARVESFNPSSRATISETR